ncbi:hypothetical protein [Flavobacterium sp. 25HG05S-40]|uniref:hypothetical protein n=1 Tax=Flavobacterium sp. 25HG05S-40 TaxID=3458682 RepID=UPI004044BB92
MIANQRNKKPVISFGLGKTEMTISLGDSVTIWQDEIFSSNYDLYYNDIKKANVYSFLIEPSEVGSYEIQVEIRQKISLQSIKSNTLKLIVE